MFLNIGGFVGQGAASKFVESPLPNRRRVSVSLAGSTNAIVHLPLRPTHAGGRASLTTMKDVCGHMRECSCGKTETTSIGRAWRGFLFQRCVCSVEAFNLFVQVT